MDDKGLPKTMSDLNFVTNVTTSSRYTSFVVVDNCGRMYLATWVERARLLPRYEVIIHELDPDLELDETVKKANEKIDRLENELKQIYERTKDLKSPLVAKSLAMFHDPEKNAEILLSEYVPGESIYVVTGGLSSRQMVPVFKKMFEAIDFQHKNNLWNLNIKDNSFLVKLEGRKILLKLMNYGFCIAKGEWEEKIRGTAVFMPPEIAFGLKEKIDERADLYSAGVLMFHCLTRKFPFEERFGAENVLERLRKRIGKETTPPALTSYRTDIPEKLIELVHKLLAKEPEERGFKSALDVVTYFAERWPDAGEDIPAERTVTFVGNDKKEG